MYRFFEAFLAFLAGLSQALITISARTTDALVTFPTAIADALVSRLFDGPQPGPRATTPSFEARIAQLTRDLRRSGGDAQLLLAELDRVITSRGRQLQDAQASIQKLEDEEAAVRERIDALKEIQPEAAKAITALLDESLETRDKKIARRDWVIFGLGVVATLIVPPFVSWVWSLVRGLL